METRHCGSGADEATYEDLPDMWATSRRKTITHKQPPTNRRCLIGQDSLL